MKVEQYDGSEERRVLTGMVVCLPFLRRLSLCWRKGLFSSRWADLVGQWCVDYHKRTGKAPGRALESLYEAWASQSRGDPDTLDLVEAFLGSLSAEYENAGDLDPTHLLDVAGAYFERVRLGKLKDALEADLEAGALDKAKEHLLLSRPLPLQDSEAADVLTDATLVREVFEAPREPLVRYPGALGEFLGSELCQDALVTYLAPIKRGKTYALLDVAWRGTLQKKRVAFFQVGDLTRRQVMARLVARAAKRPLYAGTVRLPKALLADDPEADPRVTFASKSFAKPLDVKTAEEAFREIVGRKGLDEAYFKLVVHPANTCSVATVEAGLRALEAADGWRPDVVVVDYADLLAPLSRNYDRRDQTNETWLALRRLSQVYHCLVLTATQTKAAGFTARLLNTSHFSEDLRKLAHATCVIGINETPAEKALGVQRLNMPCVREADNSDTQVVFIAGSKAICNPSMLSAWPEGM